MVRVTAVVPAIMPAVMVSAVVTDIVVCASIMTDIMIPSAVSYVAAVSFIELTHNEIENKESTADDGTHEVRLAQ